MRIPPFFPVMAVFPPVAAAVSAMVLVWQAELNKAGKTRMELNPPPVAAWT